MPKVTQPTRGLLRNRFGAVSQAHVVLFYLVLRVTTDMIKVTAVY